MAPALRLALASALSLAVLLPAGAPTALSAADDHHGIFGPNHLLVSQSVYVGTLSTVTIGQLLPPNCPSTAKCGGTANKGVPATAGYGEVLRGVSFTPGSRSEGE